jgi:hypothetical protein
VTPIEIPDVRRRLRQALDQARHAAAARREQTAAAEREYTRFLNEIAAPVFRVFAAAIKAEGYPFLIATPAGGLRLEAERSREDAIEIALDTTETPIVVGRVTRGRGRRMVASERPLREGAGVADLTEEDVLQFLLAEIVPFVAR